MLQRTERAPAAEVAPLFAPRSVAVIGASNDPTKFTGKIIPSLLRQGFTGKVYPINARRSEVQGVTCFPDLTQVPGEVDCVVYGLAPQHIQDVLTACEAKRVKLLVVASAGFGEAGPEGQALQDELVRRARRFGMRVLGPNCIGFMNLVDRCCVSAAAVMEWPDMPRGRIGLATQSGGLGLATIMYDALANGISFSHVVSTGNEGDLDTLDIARFLVEDDATDVIAMTIEAVKDTDTFIDLVMRAGAVGKPVVVLKSGRTELGKTMAASHTGALAGSSAVFDAVCVQFGIVCAGDVDDFYQLAQMFAKLRAAGKLKGLQAPGRALAAMSLSGGHVGLLADHGSSQGLRFPPFSPGTDAAISAALGFEGHFLNPLDTTAKVIGDDGFWGRCAQVLLDDPAIRTVMPILTVSHSYDRPIADLIDLAGRTDKVLAVCWAGGHFAGEGRRALQDSLVPVFLTPADAAAGLAALDLWCAVWNRPEEPREAPRGTSAGRAKLEAAIAAGRATLTERESKEILAGVGLPVTREAAVATVEEAVAAAESIGYPVAVKGEHLDILHKSEAGLVLLGLRDANGVEQAAMTVLERMAKAAPGGGGRILVQEMVPAGTEMILGIGSDPEFGRFVLLGTGGIFAEILDDVAIRLPPFGKAEAVRMIDSLKGAALLKGARGREPADLGALAELLVALGDFAVANADLVQEVDVNPLIAVNEAGGRLRAADALVVLSTAKEH